MKSTRHVLALAGVLAALVAMPATAQEAGFHHIHITASSPTEGVRWYVRHLDCEPVADRPDTADCGTAELTFMVQPTLGSTQGTGVNHISFSYPDLAAKMAELEAVGVRGSGVRLQRFPDGSTWRDVPGLYKLGYIFDPWGTRIQMVEDPDTLGFHHVQLSAEDPDATLAWYRDVLGGEPASLRGQIDALRFDDVWVLVSAHEQGVPASTVGRAIDHIAFVVDDLDAAATGMAELDVVFEQEPSVPANARTQVQRAFLVAPDGVRLEVVETGWAGLETDRPVEVATADLEPYDVPRTPWGEPDFQGVWTGNSAHGIPLERPEELEDIESLTPEEAEARRERAPWAASGATSASGATPPWDTSRPPRRGRWRWSSTRPTGASRADRRGRGASRQPRGHLGRGPHRRRPRGPQPVRALHHPRPARPDDAVHLQQRPPDRAGAGFRRHPEGDDPRDADDPDRAAPAPGPGLSSWLGIPQGRWEGDTLVVETTNFNGRAPYRGSTENMRLTERFTRLGPTVLEYQFTVDDPATWTRPWTAMFRYDKDDEQYELVEYACHEGNYGMTNILSGARPASRRRKAASRDGRETTLPRAGPTKPRERLVSGRNRKAHVDLPS